MNPLDKIFLGIGAGFIAIITLIIVWLSIANAHLHAALSAAEANSTACQMVNGDFQQKVEQQNQAITLLQNESALRARHAAEVEQTAAATAAQYQKDAARLAKLKSSGDDCKAASALLNHYVAGLK